MMPTPEQVRQNLQTWLSDPTQSRTDALTKNILQTYNRSSDLLVLAGFAKQVCTNITGPVNVTDSTMVHPDSLTSCSPENRAQYLRAYLVYSLALTIHNNTVTEDTTALLLGNLDNSLVLNCLAYFSWGTLQGNKRISHYGFPLAPKAAIEYLDPAIKNYNSIFAMGMRAEMHSKDSPARLCLILEAYARDPQGLAIKISTPKITPASLEEAIRYYPLENLDFGNLLPDPLTSDMQAALLRGLQKNPIIVQVRSKGRPLATPEISTLLRDRNSSLGPNPRRDWGKNDFDETIQGWLESDSSASHRLYSSISSGHLDRDYAIKQCHGIIESNNVINSQRAQLLLILLTKEKTTDQIQYLQTQAPLRDAFILCELAHHSSASPEESFNYAQQAADTREPIGVYALAKCYHFAIGCERNKALALALYLNIQNHPSLDGHLRQEITTHITDCIKWDLVINPRGNMCDRIEPMPVTVLCNIIEHFTQDTLVLTDGIIEQYKSNEARAALQAAILKNRAITCVIPLKAVSTDNNNTGLVGHHGNRARS